MKSLLFAGLAIMLLAGCSFINLADNSRYRVLANWPPLCHSDGSVILIQKANASATFNDPTQTAATCTRAEDHAWAYRDQLNRPRDYRLLGE